MQNTSMLPITFQNTLHLESERNPIISERKHEVRALSSAYLPQNATALLADDVLIVDYSYDTTDRQKRGSNDLRTFAYENGQGYTILLGGVTQRVNKIGIKVGDAREFDKRVKALQEMLFSLHKTDTQKRHYGIIAASLASLEDAVLQALNLSP